MARPTNTTNCCHHARSCSLLWIFCKVKAMVLCDGSCPQRPDNSDGNDAIRLSRVAACLSCPTERDRWQCPPQSATIISMVRCIYIACCVNKCLWWEPPMARIQETATSHNLANGIRPRVRAPQHDRVRVAPETVQHGGCVLFPHGQEQVGQGDDGGLFYLNTVTISVAHTSSAANGWRSAANGWRSAANGWHSVANG